MPADVTLNAGAGGAIIATDPTTSSEHYQLIKLAQGAVGTFTLVTTANALPVVIGSSFQGGVVSLSSQITVTATGPMTITSGTVTATAATNPWSSAPGFNLPTVSVSSGLSQVSALQVSPTSSIAGAGLLVITSSFGLVTQSTQPITVTSGIITLSSAPTVTATAGTNPWSSAPGFNVPTVSVSSGLVQITGTPTVLSASSGLVQISGTPLVNVVGTSSAIATVTSSGGLSVSIIAGAVGSTSVNLMGTQNVIVVTVTSGAFASGLYVFSTAGGGAGSTSVNVLGSGAFAPVTSSAGLLASLSSGTVSLSSQISVTATAGTNPWSSAPGFNIPVVSVSSGLIQLSSQITVTATGPVTMTSGTVTLSSQPGPWSSAPGFNVPVVTVSSGLIQNIPIGVVSSLGYLSTYFQSTGGAASVSVRSSASTLMGYSLFNSTAAIRSVKIYNTTSAPTVGSTTNVLLILMAPGSTGGGGANLMLPLPGLFASNGIGFTMTANVAGTDTGAPGSNDLTLNLYLV